jgi:hypothetical protein
VRIGQSCKGCGKLGEIRINLVLGG